MKKIYPLILLVMLSLSSCAEDLDDNLKAAVTTQFNFTHNWNGLPVTAADFNTVKFANENSDSLSIERLRYVISDLTFTREHGEQLIIEGHHLIDVSEDTGLVYSPELEIPTGLYTNVSFTFGLNNEYNAQNHLDLNSVSFNVPEMLGGGYHYMQMDGKFIAASGEEVGYNYHSIRAVDNPGPNPTFPQDTFFTVDLGAINLDNNATFEVKMDISEWYKNPNLWDLNEWHTVLMPNSEAQILMRENGQSVFSLGTVTQ
ncbi:MbnP family protein [Bizionia paragorgiae]|uniref:MbnP family protein n=1 Tax=Bizionia paragorgiae TaxID=283786 RepID=UPI003A954590